MAQFDELQTLWQTQPSPAIPAFDGAALAGAFRRYGRRQDIINIAKFALVIFAVVRCYTAFHDRLPIALAFGGLLFFAVVAIIAEWRIQRGIARLNFSAPSVDFVRASIARLQAQRNPYHTTAYVFLFASIFIAYNIMAFANWHKMTIERRILSHAVATAFPPLLYVFGRWIRAKRWNADYRPLVERLTVLLETLEDRAR
jgi:hypothetical protein